MLLINTLNNSEVVYAAQDVQSKVCDQPDVVGPTAVEFLACSEDDTDTYYSENGHHNEENDLQPSQSLVWNSSGQGTHEKLDVHTNKLAEVYEGVRVQNILRQFRNLLNSQRLVLIVKLDSSRCAHCKHHEVSLVQAGVGLVLGEKVNSVVLFFPERNSRLFEETAWSQDKQGTRDERKVESYYFQE